jgi:hypothetical protein
MLHQTNDALPELPWTQYLQKKPTVALHRKPGLQQIFGSIGLYTKECAADLVRVSSSGAFKAARLQWLRQMKKFPTVPVGQVFEKTCKGED